MANHKTSKCNDQGNHSKIEVSLLCQDINRIHISPYNNQNKPQYCVNLLYSFTFNHIRLRVRMQLLVVFFLAADVKLYHIVRLTVLSQRHCLSIRQ